MEKKVDYVIREVKDPAEKRKQIEEMYKTTAKKLEAKKQTRRRGNREVGFIVAFWTVFWIVVTFSVPEAGDYYRYTHSDGRLVISNIAPAEGSVAVEHRELKDVTDEEIRASEEKQKQFRIELEVEELSGKIANLTKEIREQAVAIKQRPPDTVTNIAVGSVGRSRGRSRFFKDKKGGKIKRHRRKHGRGF